MRSDSSVFNVLVATQYSPTVRINSVRVNILLTKSCSFGGNWGGGVGGGRRVTAASTFRLSLKLWIPTANGVLWLGTAVVAHCSLQIQGWAKGCGMK